MGRTQAIGFAAAIREHGQAEGTGMRLKSSMRIATDTTLRHLAMLSAIPVGLPGKSTSQIFHELRDKNPDFDVTRRTIQRSLEQLSRRFPIISETRGRTNYWYWIEPHALTQIPAMGATTAFVLSIAAEYLRPIMPPSTLSKLEPYFRHAQTILDGTDLGRWTDKTAIIAQGPTLTAPDISADVQEAVCEALMTNRRVEVKCRGKHEKEPRRIVLSPLGIVVRTGVVYLVATSWKYEDIRHYVVHRMSEPQLLDELVQTPPPDFRLADHLGDDGSFAYPASEEQLKLRALFDAGAGAHLTESRLGPDHRATEQEDGRVLVEATVPDTAQLRWWLAGFGSLVEVLGPEGLREEFREEARKLGRVYGLDSAGRPSQN